MPRGCQLSVHKSVRILPVGRQVGQAVARDGKDNGAGAGEAGFDPEWEQKAGDSAEGRDGHKRDSQVVRRPGQTAALSEAGPSKPARLREEGKRNFAAGDLLVFTID